MTHRVTNEGPVSEPDTDDREKTMLSVTDLSKRWGCSERHVRRMVDVGRCPGPEKFLSLLRWRRQVIENWEKNGCPHIRNIAKGGR
jgi:hypothetical protein